jgi:hypothetical protein
VAGRTTVDDAILRIGVARTERGVDRHATTIEIDGERMIIIIIIIIIILMRRRTRIQGGVRLEMARTQGLAEMIRVVARRIFWIERTTKK